MKKNWHSYLTRTGSIFYTATELRKLHRHFYHPNPDNLYAFMKRENPHKVSPDVMADLEKLSSTCDVFQREGDAPHIFRVSLPDYDFIFNLTVCVDLMYMNEKYVSQIFYKDTKFNTTCFLEFETTQDVWEAFMKI